MFVEIVIYSFFYIYIYIYIYDLDLSILNCTDLYTSNFKWLFHSDYAEPTGLEKYICK